MTKTFRISISLISLLLSGILFLGLPALGPLLIEFNLGWVVGLGMALFPFAILLILFLVFSFYKVVKSDTGFYFLILNIFGLVGFITYVGFFVQTYY